MRRVDPPEAFALNCRGCSLFPSPARQIADRAGLIEVGWAWSDAPRGFQLAAFDRTTMATTVRVTAVLAGGAVRSFDVTAVPGAAPGAAPTAVAPIVPVNAICPVSGAAVNPARVIVWEGRAIGFCCEKCAAQFWADPAKFVGNVKPK